MASFILRDIDPLFWLRVQAKAKAEGTTVKAVILQLLTTWLGVLALVLFTVGCHTYIPDPLAPSPVVAVVEPTPTPAPVVSPLSVSLSIGVARPSVGDNISFVASAAGTSIVRADWAFGNGATLSTSRGDTAYAYPATGTFTARVTVTASDGRTGSDQATVTVSRRETPPSTPTPTPTTPGGFVVSLACTVQDATLPTSCNVTASYHDATVASGSMTAIDWDWGDGIHAAGAPSNAHPYAFAGTYTVLATVTATTADGSRTGVGSKTIIVPNP